MSFFDERTRLRQAAGYLPLLEDQVLHIDVTPMVRPRSVAVIGASSKRVTQGNIVISNLKSWGYKGEILPVHPQADKIDDLKVIRSVADIGGETDLAIVAIPAAQVPGMLHELEASSVRSAIVFSNGFSAEEERDLRKFGTTSRLVVHGPNCMGLVNFTDSIPLYPSRPSLRLKPGKVALVAQSGSAAISVMNSTMVGLSKVITVGSEFQIAAADYIRWLANDDETTAIGVVAESIKSPLALAEAAECVHAASKSLVILKVGRSDVGIAATQAHTGALVSDRDAYDSFFCETNIATVADYDELIASLECAVTARKMVAGAAIGIVGISGGQTALACDLAEARSVPVAAFGDKTRARLCAALPGTGGNNPVDIGATVNVEDRNVPEVLRAVLDDDQVGALVLLQDLQESLNPATLQNYMRVLTVYADAGRTAGKPIALISPTGEAVSADVRAMLRENGIPVVRGLHAGLRAVGNLALGHSGLAGEWVSRHGASRALAPEISALKREVEAAAGALDADLSFRLLNAYGIPTVRSTIAVNADDAVLRSAEVGFPMVVKVASRDVKHRSDIGAVLRHVRDEDALRRAVKTIEQNVAAALPHAVIDGYELQEELADHVEALLGFTAAAPFGSMMVVGSGGTLVELLADRRTGLAPVSPELAKSLIQGTKLGRILAGYRNLVPETATAALVDTAVKLSYLAQDFEGLIGACDLNPVLIRKQTGDCYIVDALFIRTI